MLVFDPTFFDGEVREGFYVTSMMKRCWAAQLEVLKEIEKVCKNHNLKYFAEFGTLIGAVRHKGFIPWDDDMDISMSRKDLNQFIKYAREELPEGYRVYTPKEEFKEFLVRVVNTNNLRDGFDRMSRFHGFPFVAGMDIFIYDDIPEDKEEEETLLLLMGIAHNLGYNWNNTEKETLEEKMEILNELSIACNYKFNDKEPYQVQLLELTQYLASCYADDNATEVGMLYRLRRNPHCRYPKSYITDLIEVPFESTTIMIPRAYDEMLTKVYGDYMKRVRGKQGLTGHVYPYYKSQQETFMKIMEESNVKLPDYFYEECSNE